MTSSVVTIGRHSYAVGLYWENSPGGGRVAQIAKEAARQSSQQAEFFAVRSGNKNGRIPQFGLTSGENNKLTAGMPVLAACLAGQVPGSWAGAFKLGQGVALVIVRDDLIVPDGDLFFTDEAEARDRLIQEIGFGGLQGTYAPEAWSVPGADTIPLTLLLNDRRDVKLQQVQIPPRTKYIVAGGVLAFILALGGAWYWQAQLDAERARLEAEQAALRRAQMAKNLIPGLSNQPVPQPVYDRAWEKTAKPLEIIENCRQGLSKIPAALGGWKLGSMSCNGASLNITWTRLRGATQTPTGANVNDVASVASQVIALPPLKPRGGEELVAKNAITSRYLEKNWPGTLARLPDDPLPQPPPGYKGPWNPPPAPWVKRSFTLTVPELPYMIPDLFGDLPGITIKSMSYSGTALKGNWSIEGVIYENRK